MKSFSTSCLLAQPALHPNHSNLSKEIFEIELIREAAEPAASSAAEARRAELLDQLTQTIQRHFRALRRPMPTREAITEMVKEHFGGQSSDT
jgi:hypothetical protein